MGNRTHTVEEQVGNLLNVAKLHRGQWVLAKRQNGKTEALTSLNPYMSDGGIQPPGPPLYGPTLFDRQSECAALAERANARAAKCAPTAHGVVAAAIYVAMSVEDWVASSLVSVPGRDGLTLAEVLQQRPSLRAAEPEPLAKMPGHWVLTLNGDTPVDVVLAREGDFVSEDCFLTTTKALVTAGYGQLAYEGGSERTTVYVTDRAQWWYMRGRLG